MKVIILIFLLFAGTKVFALTNVLEQEALEFESIMLRTLPLDHDLMIQFQPLNPRVNAEIIKKDQQLIIEVMGGMLGHPKMNENSFKLLLCHELGHFQGGPPYKARGGWSSTEGQADYFSGRQCSKQLGMTEDEFLDGALILTSIYAEVMREAAPRMDQCDERQVLRTNFGYPSVQCRLDTILAGWTESPRPICWFFD